MYDVLKGVRVVEVAEWMFVPAAVSILADWGADVVKIEHPQRGDAVRGLSHVNFLVCNRGKRSVGLDISKPQGREILEKMIAGADVFVTSLMAPARRKLGIESDQLTAKYPRLIYARGTGHGLRGPAADKGGFDLAATWQRAGLANQMTQPGQTPPGMPGSIGDLNAGSSLAGAIAAALFRRERTGKGGVVDHSIFAAGVWMMTQSIIRNSLVPDGRPEFVGGANPLVKVYKTKDDRWIGLTFLQGDRWWPDLCRHLNRPELAEDPRFKLQDARAANAEACIAELTKEFASKTYAEWLPILETLEGVWAPLQNGAEVAVDPQALVNGYVTPVPSSDGAVLMESASPGQFDEQPVGELGAAPEAWQHTEEVLLELGVDWDQIADLQSQKVIP
ncbi:MAG: CoA transferase [Phenylobacterium sp.]